MTDSKKPGPADIAAGWWRELTSDTAAGRLPRGVRRAALAEMRRAKSPLEILQQPAALRLIGNLPPLLADRGAILAGILAHVREDDRRDVARAIGRATFDDPDSAVMSESRFRRLMQTEEDGLLEAMRRLVRLMNGKVNVADLAKATLCWGDDVKKTWIFRYYDPYGTHAPKAATPPAPADSPLT